MAIKSIGIDIREANGKGAGKGNYCEEITRSLIKHAPAGTEFVLFSKEHSPLFPNGASVNQVLIPGSGFKWHLNLRKYLKQKPVDCFLATTSYIYPAIAPKTQPIATVVHDLVAFLYPQHNSFFATLVERITLSRAIQRSQWIVTVSENTAKDLKKLIPAAAQKPMTVAHPASNENHKSNVKKILDLPARYMLAVGTLQPRKNFTAIFQTFEALAAKDQDLNLCIVGGKGWKQSKVFKNLPKNLEHRIHFMGYVETSALNEIYSRAQLLLFPSIYEGFGMPPLEAMACSCPVVTSNAGSLPEVVGDAAITVDSMDIPAMVKACQFLLSPSGRRHHQERGLKRARMFSWKKSALVILDLINRRK